MLMTTPNTQQFHFYLELHKVTGPDDDYLSFLPQRFYCLWEIGV